MSIRPVRCGLVVLVCSAAADIAAAQVMVGQVDTFQGGTTQGWSAGGPHPAPPTVIGTGGPAGAGDAFLQVTSLGNVGPGSRLSAMNSEQWAGNYIGAGVTAITMDVRNSGPDDLFLRLRFWDGPAGGFPDNVAITDAAFVPAGSGWVSITLSLDPASMTALVGDAGAALANTAEVRLFHNPAPDYPPAPLGPPAVIAVLGVDNIAAVPGPSAAVLGAGACAALGLRRRRRARN